MSRLIKWESVCLVCLQKGENRCIFGEDNDSIVIADKIMKYSDIWIKRDTNQPNSICLQCLDDLNIAYKFRRNYEHSESIIKALLNTNHQQFQIKDLWKTSPTTRNPILDICIKDEVAGNAAVNGSCENTPCLNFEDDADTKAKVAVEDRADSYVHSNSTELNNPKTGQNNKSIQKMKYKIPMRSRDRQNKLSEESTFTSDYISPVKICQICNCGLRDQSSYTIHMRRHNNERPFSCVHCDKGFVTRVELQRHVRVHTGEKPYKCQYCDLRFSDMRVKKNHESKHTGEKPFKCPTCDKSFGYSKDLKFHLRIHNKSTCEEFKRVKVFKKHANRHLNRVEVNNSSEHTQTKSLDKEIFQIQENTNSNEIIIKHEIVEDHLIGDNCDIESTPCVHVENAPVSGARNGEIVQQSKGEIPKRSRPRPKRSTRVSLKICEICNHDFTTQRDLDVHMRRHNNQRCFSCDHCDKTFVGSWELRRHVRLHTGEKPYKCQYCDLRFSYLYVKVNHESNHTGEKPFKCPTCDKSFGYSKGLKWHLRIHNKSSCKEFRRQNVFKKHENRHLNRVEVNNSSEDTQTKSLDKEIFQIRENTNSNEIIIKHEIVEDNLIAYNCDNGSTTCIDEEYGTVSEATNGEIVQQSKVEIPKPRRVRPKQSMRVSLKICEICNHDFRDQHALDVHMRRHNNQRRFRCDHCDKVFVTGAELRSHMRVHTGEKPYKCQYCDLRFSEMSVKKNHESKHTGEKPFKCPTCDRSFGYSKGLKCHLRIHNKSICKEFRREKLFPKHANRHLNRVGVNNSSEHTQTKSLDKEIFQIQENTNSNEIIIKHEIVEDHLIGDNCDNGNTTCIDEEYGTVSEATNEKIVPQSKVEIPKHPRVRRKQLTGVSSKICEICNHGFRDQYELDNHIRRHNNERPFSCDHCGKTFVTREDLRRHVRLHTGERPYECQYCDLRFYSNQVKRSHESKHTGEKPFKCPTCNKSFGYSQGLKCHLRIHNSKNKFTCEECGKEFTKKVPFEKHVAQHLTGNELDKSSEHEQKKRLDKEIGDMGNALRFEENKDQT